MPKYINSLMLLQDRNTTLQISKLENNYGTHGAEIIYIWQKFNRRIRCLLFYKIKFFNHISVYLLFINHLMNRA